MVDGVCEPIAQWRVSASEPKAREREKSLVGLVDIVVDGMRTNCVAVVWITGITYALASWCIHLVAVKNRVRSLSRLWKKIVVLPQKK